MGHYARTDLQGHCRHCLRSRYQSLSLRTPTTAALLTAAAPYALTKWRPLLTARAHASTELSPTHRCTLIECSATVCFRYQFLRRSFALSCVAYMLHHRAPKVRKWLEVVTQQAASRCQRCNLAAVCGCPLAHVKAAENGVAVWSILSMLLSVAASVPL